MTIRAFISLAIGLSVLTSCKRVVREDRGSISRIAAPIPHNSVEGAQIADVK